MMRPFSLPSRPPLTVFILGLLLLLLAACTSAAAPTTTPATTRLAAATATQTPAPFATHAVNESYLATIEAKRSPDVPDLPFPDNPDPTLCGIPTQWNSTEPAWLTGFYEGALIEPTVHLYDSHLRLNVQATAPHGTQVQVLLYQRNPQLDYYLVKVVGAEQPTEGWVPGPFLSFEPAPPAG